MRPGGRVDRTALGPNDAFYFETDRTANSNRQARRRFDFRSPVFLRLHAALRWRMGHRSLGFSPMPKSDNPPFPGALRLFSAAVIIVLIVGAGLFFAPALVKPRWPWPVTPFSARFLGGFYTAEMAV